MNPQFIDIPLGNGLRLSAEGNPDVKYSKEIFVGIRDENDVWVQDLAVIRPALNDNGEFQDDAFEVLVYGDKYDEDYTNKFEVGLYNEDD